MLKEEFEAMTLKGNATISGMLYEAIERYYMSDNDYHRYNNPQGLNEDKKSFCQRVFGGKVNTPKTILDKITKESIKENRYCLPNINKNRSDEMDTLLIEHYEYLSRHNY